MTNSIYSWPIPTVLRNLANGEVSSDAATIAQVEDAVANGYGNANVAVYLPTNTADVGAANVDASGNVTASYFIGDGSQLTGLPASYGNAEVAAYLPTYTGNLAGGNANITGAVVANSFAGDGSLLTGLYGNANVGDYLPTYTGNITATSVSTTGNITGLYIKGDGSLLTGLPANYGNAEVADYLPTYTGDLAGNSISVAGNVTGQYFVGDGRYLINVYGNANVANYLPTYSGNLTAGNISTTGLVNATGNISSGSNIIASGYATITGNITGANFNTAGLVNATGNLIGGNVRTAGLVTATGTITGGNFVSAGNATITGNITGGNVSTAGLVTAAGNITGGNFVSAGNATITGNITGGNVSTAGLVTAAGNITGANFNTAGIVNATGNISTGANVIASGYASVTGNVQAGNIRTAGLVSATGNVSGGNISTAGNVTGAYIIGDGSQLTNVPIATRIANGNSNVSIPAAGGNITMAVTNTPAFNMTSNTLAILSGAGTTTQGAQAIAIGQNSGSNAQGIAAIAVGAGAATSSQGSHAIAIGYNAGTTTQSTQSVAIGYAAGASTQGAQAVALGMNAGTLSQGANSVAIGYNAGFTSLGLNSVAVGAYAGQNLVAGAIALNASGAALNGNNAGLYINPIRNDATNIANVAFYNTSTKEVTYANTISLAGNITGNYILGNGSQLTGMYSNTNVSNYLPTYTGNITAGNVSVSGNVTTNGFVSNTISINGNAYVNGNLTVAGNIDYTNVQDLVVGDPLIFVGANNTSDIVDLGMMVKFNNGTQQYGGFVRDHTDGVWKLFSNVITAPTTDVNFANAIYSTLQAGAFIGDGSQLTGMYGNANVALYLPTNTANIKAGNISVTGNITGAGGNTSIDNIKIGFNTPATGSFTNITASGTANVTGNATVGNLNSTSEITALGNIGAVGYISAIGNVHGSSLISSSSIQGISLSVSGNVTGNSVLASGLVSAAGNVTGGNFNTAGLVSAAGNITGGNISTAGIVSGGSVSTAGNVTGAFIIGNGSLLSNITAANIIGAYGNSNVAAYLPTNTANINAAVVTATLFSGNGSQISNVNIANIAGSYANSNVAAYLPIYTGNINAAVVTATLFSGNGSQISNINIANIAGSYANSNVAAYLPIYTGNINAAVVTATLFSGDGSLLSNINAANITGAYGNSNVAAYLPSYTGNLAGGNINIGNALVAATLAGDGSRLSNITAANITGAYGNSNVAAYLPTYTGNITAGNANISGALVAATLAGDGSRLSNITAANITGAYGNSNVAAYLPTYTGNITAGNANISGGVVAATFAGDGSLLSNITAANIDGAYGNSNVAVYLPTYTGNLSPGNLTVSGETNLGNIINVTITGGSNNQVIVTDGAGNLSFGNVVNVIPAVHFSANATANNQTFSNTVLQGYTANTDMTLFYNGALLDSSYYTLSGDTVTVNTPLYSGDNIDIIKQFNGSFNTVTNSAYANANVAAYLTTYSGNLTVSNISAAGNVVGNSFIGNGSQLSGMYSNTNVSNYLPTYTGIVGASNINASGEIAVATNNAHGGAGFAGIMTMTNTTANATNINKYLRLSNTGAMQVVNSAYSDIIMSLADTGALSVPLRNDTGNTTKALYFNSVTNEITYAAASASFAGFQAPFAGGNITSNYAGQWIQMSGNSTLPQASTVPAGTVFWITSLASTTPYTLTVFNTGTDFIYLPPTYSTTTRSINLFGGQWVQLISRGTGEWDVVSTNVNTTQKVSSTVASSASLAMDNIAIKYDGSGVWRIGPVSGSVTFAGSSIVNSVGSAPANNTLASQSIASGSPVVINTTTAGTAGDTVVLNVSDNTNTRQYRVTMINTTSSASYVSIERLYG